MGLSRADTLLAAVTARVTENYLDESAIEYEAARLSTHAVVLVLYWDCAAVESKDVSKPVGELTVAKGQAEVAAYLSDDAPLPEFEAVLAVDRQAALALRSAIHRRSGLRLIK